MTAKDKGKVSSTAFPAGSTVKLHDRVGDFLGALGKAVASKKVSKEGVVEFDGLPEGGPYWAVSEDQPAVKVTAKDPLTPKERTERPTGAVASQTRSEDAPRTVVTGARSTVTAKPKDEAARKRSAASKKAAATRKRNAAKKGK